MNIKAINEGDEMGWTPNTCGWFGKPKSRMIWLLDI